MKINATTVPEYLDALPEDRRAVIVAVRKVIRKNLPKGYREALTYGMISYEVPLEQSRDICNGQPLSYVCLAAQKNHYSLYLMCAYGDAKRLNWLRSEFQKAGKKLDMGKSCVRFRKLEDLPLDVIGEFVAAVTPEKYIAACETMRKQQQGRTAKKA